MKLKAFFKRGLPRTSKDKNKTNKTKGGSKNAGAGSGSGSGSGSGKADVASAAPPVSPAKGAPAKTQPPASPTSVAAAATTSSGESKSKPGAVQDFDAKVFRKEEIDAARKAGPVDLDDDLDATDNPDSVGMTDRRGRTPLGMAEEMSPESSRRADYLYVLHSKNVGIEEVLLDRMTADDVSMVSANSLLQTNGGKRGQNCAGFKTKAYFDDDSADELTMSGWSCNDNSWFSGCEADGYDKGNGNDPSKSGSNNCIKDMTILEEIDEIC